MAKDRILFKAGKIQFKGGKIQFAEAGHAADCSCCGGGGGSCTPLTGVDNFGHPDSTLAAFCATMPTSLLINEWLSIVNCAACNITTANPAWDGTMALLGPASGCFWQHDRATYGGKYITAGLLAVVSTVDSNCAFDHWELSLACGVAGSPVAGSATVWIGCNPCYDPRDGVFTEYAGCSGPATLTLS